MISNSHRRLHEYHDDEYDYISGSQRTMRRVQNNSKKANYRDNDAAKNLLLSDVHLIKNTQLPKLGLKHSINSLSLPMGLNMPTEAHRHRKRKNTPKRRCS